MNIYDLINRDIKCECGRTHRCDVGVLEIGKNALDKIADRMSDRKHVLLVADSNTYPLCGDRVKALLGDSIESVCIFETDEFLVPNEESVDIIRSYLTDKTDFILGIGSGVINDLCKYVAFYRGIKSGIIATATSMDGYASSGAAMILGGMKVTDTTCPPDVIIGDVDILKDAPMDMISAGYADIMGKYSALCDWKLANLINGEYLCPFIYDMVMDSTNEIRSLAPQIVARDPDAIGKLMETLVLIGTCMTLAFSTRPGSGSEHHLSHFYEITGLIEDKPYFLHGTDVGYATIVTAGLREQIVKIEKPQFHHISDELKETCYKKIYKDYWTEVKAIQDKSGWYAKDLDGIYAEKWDEIVSILRECPTADEIKDILVEVGFDLSAFEKMYGAQKIQNSIWFGKDLKDRYSVLWLYSELYLTDEEAAKVI